MFDRFIAVDWSAANAPRTGGDSIWVAVAEGDEPVQAVNPSTRAAAMALVDRLCATGRTLASFDFAFGYPAGSDALPEAGKWPDVWTWIGANVADGADNRSNRYEVASRLNGAFGATGPFWGHPHQHEGRYPFLAPTKPDYAELGVRERRACERIVPRAQPVWKLAYTGSVGSQALLGIKRLEEWRQALGEDAAVWPFQTGFADDLGARIVIAEIYPSLWPVERNGASCLDEAQVRTIADLMRRHHRDGRLEAMLGGPSDATMRAEALTCEGWIYGVGNTVLAA